MGDETDRQPEQDAGPVSGDGYHPQTGEIFRYRAGEIEFWFYVETRFLNPHDYVVVVTTASVKKVEGGIPVFTPGQASQIEADIRSYFERFDPYGHEFAPNESRPDVTFGWRIRSERIQ